MKNRSEKLNELLFGHWDLLIIGGGITGAGIALDAASRGIKTALVEKNDFASGTSSKSTKLVHGGLRYLKQLEFALVSEVGRERAIVHKNAPHLVIPEKMLMPLVKGGTYGRLSSSFGLEVYDILANVQKQDRMHMLSKEETLAIEPLLNEETLLGSGYYSEYRTDDARLTIELIKAAQRKGAVCLNYCEVHSLSDEDSKISGVVCSDHIGGHEVYVKARYVVNAGGPWVDHIRRMNNSITKKRLHLTKGVHIVLPHEKLPVKHSIYFDVPDGRMIFTIPRGRTTYIGTTDTDYQGDLDNILTTREDAKYLIDAVNSTFPGIRLTLGDIESSWAGIRPLIHQEGKSTSEISRKDEIFEAPDGLISIAGGKLTGYRKMAQKTVDLVVKRFEKFDGIKFGPCITRHIPLTEDPLWNVEEVDYYRSIISQKLKDLGLSDYYAGYLVANYGKQSELIISLMDQFKTSQPEEALIRSELKYGVDQEMVCTSVDFFDRRTGRLSFDIDRVVLYKDIILNDLSGYSEWSDEQKAADKNLLDKRISSTSPVHR
ncbi:MAG: glycerol-3-phosphate dehydrogenase/oxidase [Porphyromonadaceae bacterium]|nr:MAG: glycerol-3-phosphate dehydrogenase/oxidase [Porphyromonadaceae bacterium]